jgi:hypothetical protein
MTKETIDAINFITSSEIYMNQKYIRLYYNHWRPYYATKVALRIVKY